MIIKKYARPMLLIVTAIQAVSALVWLIMTLPDLQLFSMSANYRAAMETLVTDDYMDWFYALTLWIVSHVFGSGNAFSVALTLIQFAMLAASIYFFISTLVKDWWMRCCLTVYIVSLPVVVSAANTLLPGAFRTAVITTVMGVIIRIAKSDFSRGIRTIRIFGCLSVLFLLSIVSDSQGKPNAYGWGDKTREVYMMQRFAWPHFSEIDIATEMIAETDAEGARATDMYYLTPERIFTDFVPALENRYTKDRAGDIVRAIADRGFMCFKREIATESLWDFASYAFAPYTILANLSGRGFSYTGVNYGEFTKHTGIFGVVYFRLSMYLFVAWTLIAIANLFNKPHFNKTGMRMFAVIAILASAYYSFAGVRGFDYKNVLFVMIAWVLAVMLPVIEQKGERQWP